MKQTTRELTYGAMTMALSALTIILNAVFSQMLTFILALPLAVYGAYHRFRSSLITYLGCILVAFMVSGSLPTMLLMIGYGAIALALVYAQQKGLSTWQQYLFMTVVGIPIYVIMIAFFEIFFGLDFALLQQQFGLVLAVIGVGLTLFMEIYIIFTLQKIVIYALPAHRK